MKPPWAIENKLKTIEIFTGNNNNTWNVEIHVSQRQSTLICMFQCTIN